jgi:hypothetical protein
MDNPATNTGEPSQVDEMDFPSPGEYSALNVLHMSDEETVYSLFLSYSIIFLIAYQAFKCVVCWLRSGCYTILR